MSGRFVVLMVLVLSACSGMSERDIRSLNYGFDDVSARAAAAAEVCSSPVPATVVVGKDFKYGCFCGADYPSIVVPPISGESIEDGRRRISHAYYAVKPVDDLDRSCLRHDVCYILNEKSISECNAAFKGELESLRSSLKSENSRVDSYQFRCQVMIGDIGMGAIFMRQASKTPGVAAGNNAGKVSAALIIAVPALLRKLDVHRALGEYPRLGEHCSALL